MKGVFSAVCICTCNSWCGYIGWWWWWWLTGSVCLGWWLVFWRAVEFSLRKSFHHGAVLRVALSTAALLLCVFCHYVIVAAVVTEDTATQPAKKHRITISPNFRKHKKTCNIFKPNKAPFIMFFILNLKYLYSVFTFGSLGSFYSKKEIHTFSPDSLLIFKTKPKDTK